MKDPKVRAPGKRERMRIERPQEILAAALSEFMDKGYAAARVEDIGRTVGVTKGTVYFYFESKENLFAQTIRAFSPPLGEFDPGFDATRPVRPQLERYVSRLFDRIARETSGRQVLHLLTAEGRHFPQLVDLYYEEFLTPVLSQLRTMLAVGTAQGEFRSTALPMAELLLAPAMMANIWISVLADRRPHEPDLFAACQGFILEALAIRPTTDAPATSEKARTDDASDTPQRLGK